MKTPGRDPADVIDDVSIEGGLDEDKRKDVPEVSARDGAEDTAPTKIGAIEGGVADIADRNVGASMKSVPDGNIVGSIVSGGVGAVTQSIAGGGGGLREIAGSGVAAVTGGALNSPVGSIAGTVAGDIVAGKSLSGIVNTAASTVATKVASTVATKALGAVAGTVAGAIAGGVAGKVLGAGGALPGVLAGNELPVFEAKAITSALGKNGPLQGRGGGLTARGSSAVSQLTEKNLEVTIASGDALDVRQFSVHERMSSLFQVDLIAVSQSPSIDFDVVVGHAASFLLRGGTRDRLWSGVCNHFEQVRVEPTGLSTYQVSIVPALWFLTQRKNYRMFQQLSEPEIVLKVLKEWDIEPKVQIDKEAYKKRKYRVQYAESDFAFISRMLEDAGIAYYFEQAGEETKLVLSDAPQSNPKREPVLLFLDDTSMVRQVQNEFVTGVRMVQRVRPGKYTLRDHDYRRSPSYKLMSSAAGGKGIEEKLERFDYRPGAFLFGVDQGDATPVADDKGKTRTDEKEAAILAKKRLDAKRGSARVCTFDTNGHDLSPGVVMSIANHPNEALAETKTWLIVESALSGSDQGEWSHHCEARGTEIPYRPDTVTPKPTVNGVESATVVGPPGEEIHTDEFGRVRVHFHWNRESTMDDNSSCWIHVAQAWAGTGFGMINIPRVGQEVLVDFLSGDPDRPVIVGKVYTNLQKVPYKLPDNKTQSGLKSSSTGGTGGYNEIMFEDAQGREVVNIQAERDLTALVKNDATFTIKGNQTSTVWKNDSTLVGAQHSITISPSSQGAPTNGPTSATMSHKKIVLTTGEATVTIEGSTITLDADSSIKLESRGTIDIHATSGIKIKSDAGDVVVRGDPKVKINCAE
jgi:type VI secretion system secreted protein VgrG